MAQDKNFRLLTQDDIDRLAQTASEPSPQIRMTPISNPSEGLARELLEADQRYTRTPPSSRGIFVDERGSHAFVTWLSSVVKTVASTIRGFWSSITLSRPTRAKPSLDLFHKDMLGPPKSSDVRLGNAVYFAPTATDDILLNSRITTAIQTYEQRCRRFMTLTRSNEEYETIREGLAAGTLDLDSISFADWLNVSFLALFDGNEELQMEPKIVFKGNVYHIHVCVQGVVPGQQVAALHNKV